MANKEITYKVGISDDRDKGTGPELDLTNQVHLFTIDSQKFHELEKLIEAKIELAVAGRLAEMDAQLKEWFSKENKKNDKTRKEQKALSIANHKHMSVVEGYLQSFQALVKRLK